MEQVEIVGTTQHAAWQARTLPPVERLPRGTWSIPVPIPHSPLRYTLSYLVTGDDGLVVVDPGWDSDESWAALSAGIAAAGAEITDVVGIVATHVHPDHHGLSARLARAADAWIAMHPAEVSTLPHRIGLATQEERRTTVSGWLCDCGAPEDEARELTGPHPGQPNAEKMAEPDVLLRDGDVVPLPGRRVRVVWTPGHTPGHICLLDAEGGVLLTGDHVLPRITPNIGISPGVDAPALATFLSSLDTVANLDDEHGGLVALPAHEYRFRGLAARARALQEHHARRCRELLDTVRDSGRPTLWEATSRLSWSRPWEDVGRMRIGALAETAAHARYLADRGELAVSGGRSDWAPAAGVGPTVRLSVEQKSR